MKVSGFSYVRNGIKYQYPFLQAIQSILPLCDEFVIAVGNSEDGTRNAIENLGSSKLKIIDTIWDETLRSNGKIFAQQANIALQECKGDWIFHIQADEVIHEADLPKIKAALINEFDNPKVEGFLFDFLNFYGSYDYLNDTRYQHRKEIRIVRNNQNIFSYKDSQGFRKYSSWDSYQSGDKGTKLAVKYLAVPVYHYSYVRSPKVMNEKAKYFESFWHTDDYIAQTYQGKDTFDYYQLDKVKKFSGMHPALMADLVQAGDYSFDPSLIKKKNNFKTRVAYFLDGLLGFRVGEYKNYKLIK